MHIEWAPTDRQFHSRKNRKWIEISDVRKHTYEKSLQKMTTMAAAAATNEHCAKLRNFFFVWIVCTLTRALRSLLCACGLFTHAFGGEHTSEGVRKRVYMFCLALLLFLSCVLLAWWFCSFLLLFRRTFLYFARFRTYSNVCVCFFVRFLHTFFSLSIVQ